MPMAGVTTEVPDPNRWSLPAVCIVDAAGPRLQALGRSLARRGRSIRGFPGLAGSEEKVFGEKSLFTPQLLPFV
jgi:hypothetical protein